MNEVLETWRNEDYTKRYKIVYDTDAINPLEYSATMNIEAYEQWRDGNIFGIIEETRHEWHDANGNTMNTWDETNSLWSVFYGFEQINPEDIRDIMGINESLTKVNE